MRHLQFQIAVCLVLAGCGPRISNEERQIYSDAARDCIQREAVAVAALNVDLETAATAVLGRCHSALAAERNSFIAMYPGYRDVVEPRLRELALLWQFYSCRRSLHIHFRQYGHRCGGGRAKSARMA